MSGAVLVVTERFDVTADHVVLDLEARGAPVFRFDTAEFPLAMGVDARLDQPDHGCIRTRQRQVDLGDVAAVYYRRPSIYQVDRNLDDFDQVWAVREARFGFGGLLASFPRWLNHPADIARAEYKPVQFAAAREAGLRIPPTLLTNDASSARAFAAHVGPIVYKPLSGVAYRHGSGRDFIYTQPVGPDELDDDAIASTACLFQQWVPKKYEVRLTAVDDRHFAARIDAGSERGRVDWRADYDSLSYRTISVPDGIAEAVRRFLRKLRLRFGALDFIVTPDDEWVWLEVNPNGQWAWIDELTPRIAGAIADALCNGSTT